MVWQLSDLTLAAGLLVVGVTLIAGITGLLVYHEQKTSVGPRCAQSPVQNAYFLASFGAFWSIVAVAAAMAGLSVYKKVTNSRFKSNGRQS
jgi:hypothetical protein